jgi:hypothetical protein
MDHRVTLLQKLDDIQTALIAACTQDPGDTAVYEPLRLEFLADPTVAPLLPDFVRRYRTLKQFWPFIKRKYASYAERRQFIWDSFGPAIVYAEQLSPMPADSRVAAVLETLSADHIRAAWTKAIARLAADPEGAITAARSLIESVCKLILDEPGIAYF